MVNKAYVIIPAVAVAIGIGAAVMFAQSATPAIDIQEGSVEERRLSLFATGSPILGSLDAPLTMVEFGDYQCLNCNRYFHNTEHTIVQNYVETGKLKVIYMDFAFIGQDSMFAAQAAHCAEEQGKYWEYHDALFSNWNGENTGWASMHNLKRFADNVGLEHKSFNECLDSGKYASKVRHNTDMGRQLGVTGTPTFFIFKSEGDAQKIVGSQPYSTFNTVLDSMLR